MTCQTSVLAHNLQNFGSITWIWVIYAHFSSDIIWSTRYLHTSDLFLGASSNSWRFWCLERLGGVFNSCRGVCGTSGVCIRGVSTYYLGWGASSSNSTRNLGPIFGTSCVSLGLVGELGGLQGISLRWSSIWDLIWRLLRNSSPLGSIWDLSILGRSQVPGFSRQRPLKSSCHPGYYMVLFICEKGKILSGLVVVW